LSAERATEIGKMDHHYLGFIDFLWCSWWVTLRLQLYVFRMYIQKRVQNYFGFVQEKCLSTDNEQMVLDAVLNLPTLATWLCNLKKDADGNITCCFIAPNAAHINKDKGVTAGDFDMHLDITNRKVLSATYCEKTIDLDEASALLVDIWLAQSHTILHAYGNWGVNIDAPNPFIRRMSVVTIKLNSVGALYFEFVDNLAKIGMANYCNGENTAILAANGTGIYTVPKHTVLLELQDHSPIIEFIVKVRGFFMKQFVKHQEDFPGIDGEALFVCTVIHSLDHWEAKKHLKTVFMKKDDSEFSGDKEWASLAIDFAAEYTDDAKYNWFENRFSHAPHAFYNDVYRFAAGINQEFAEQLQACMAG